MKKKIFLFLNLRASISVLISILVSVLISLICSCQSLDSKYQSSAKVPSDIKLSPDIHQNKSEVTSSGSSLEVNADIKSSIESRSTESRSLESRIIESQFLNQENKLYKSNGKKFAISTQGYYSTEAAKEMLNLKGNLIDAFVAASFAISVERPHSTGIGGGGFLVLKLANGKETLSFDFRERAPKLASKDMYLDKNGNALELLSKDGVLAVGTPGLVKGLWETHKKYGRLPWKKVLEPAIRIAEKGFVIYPNLAKALEERSEVLKKFNDSKKIFLDNSGKPLRLGQLLVQSDLAKTLKKIAKTGEIVFYKGEIANKIISYSKKHQGLLQKKDLTEYKVIYRKPVIEKFKNYTLVSMPPPSSGGIHVLQFLKLLEPLNFTTKDINTSKLIHYQAASFQMAFADRAKYLGDPDFIHVPVQQLLDEKYLDKRRNEIPASRARTVNEVDFGKVNIITSNRTEHTETTHISMMDDEGNAISSTQTINGYFGSGAVVDGTGILLNNEMDDFSVKPGVPNLFGAVGSEANAIEPLKTPLSSMSPTIVLDEKSRPIMSVGAPGGTRIISCTALTLYNVLNFKMNLDEAIKNIRIHHQWKPDKLFIESPGLPVTAMNDLKEKGYQVELGNIPCRVMAVTKDFETGDYSAVADPRDIGTSATGK